MKAKQITHYLGLILVIIGLMLPPVFSLEDKPIGTTLAGKQNNEQGGFGKVTLISVSQHAEEQTTLLLRTNTPIPVQGRVTNNSGSALQNQNIFVCINDTLGVNRCDPTTTDGNGLFQVDVLYNLEDPHATHYLTIYRDSINPANILVDQELFYPAGGPQGNLTVNGVLNVAQNGYVTGSPICTSGNGLCTTDLSNFYNKTMSDSRYQREIGIDCGAGQVVKGVYDNGTLVCVQDNSSQYSAGAGLILTGNIFSINNTYIQTIKVNNATYADNAGNIPWSSVTGKPADITTCAGANQSIKTLNLSTGTVTCETDDGGTAETDPVWTSEKGNYTLKTDLNGTGTINLATNPVDWTRLKSVPAGFSDGVDDNTIYTAGSGLILTGNIFSINNTYIQTIKVNNATFADSAGSIPWNGITSKPTNITSCNAGNLSIKTVDFATGTVTCEVDDSGIAGVADIWVNQTGDSMTGTLTITNNANLTVAGMLGVGTATPSYKMEINAADKALNVSNMLFANASAVSVGTTNILADAPLTVSRTIDNGSYLRIANVFSGSNSRSGTIIQSESGQLQILTSSALYSGSQPANSAAITTSSSMSGGLHIGTGNTNAPLKFYTNTTQTGTSAGLAMTIDPAQRVGIGTAAPGSKLTVASGGIMVANAGYESTAVASGSIELNSNLLFAGGGTNYIQNLDVGNIVFRTWNGVTNVDALTINSTGKVGIGTATPNATLLLDVEGNVGATQYCDQNGLNCKTIIQLSTDNITGAGTPNYIPKWLTSGTLATSVIYENSSKIGIGTTSPESALHIVGLDNLFKLTGTYGTSSSSEFIVKGFSTYSNRNLVFDRSQASDGWTIETTLRDGTPGYGLYLNPRGGNVGIGTTVPTAKLEINYPSTATSGSLIGLNSTVINSAFGSTATSTGIYGSVLSDGATGTRTAYGGYFQGIVDSGASQTVYGIYANASGSQPKTAYGVYASADGNSINNNYGIYATASGALGPGTNYAGYFNQGNVYVTNNLTVDTNTLLVDSTNNKVGIGTTTPTAKLMVAQDVVNTAPINGLESAQIMAVGSTNNLQRTLVGYDTTNDYGFIYAGISGTAWKNLVLQGGGGNVGIGTSTPNALLEVKSSSGGEITASNSQTSVTAGTVLGNLTFKTYDDSAGGTSGITVASIAGIASGGHTSSNLPTDLVFSTSSLFASPNVERMRIDSSGNVGIGTSAPLAPLHIIGQNKNVILIENAAAGGYSHGIYTQYSSTVAANNRLIFNISGTTAGTGTSVMTLNGAGNVGIGTSAPSGYGNGGTYRLIEISNPATTSNAQGLLMLSTGATSNLGAIGGVQWIVPNSAGSEKRAGIVGMGIDSDSSTAVTGSMTFWTTNAGSITEKMRITPAGNIGIGTSAPTSKLEINGNRQLLYLKTSNNEMVTNGQFSGDSSWQKGAGWTISTTASVTSFAPTTIEQNINVLAGHIYKLNYTIKSLMSGTVTPQLGGVNGATRNATGTYIDYITTTGTGNLSFTTAAFFTQLIIDDVSVTEHKMRIDNDFVIDSGGRVGIGVTTPAEAQLQVYASNGNGKDTQTGRFHTQTPNNMLIYGDLARSIVEGSGNTSFAFGESGAIVDQGMPEDFMLAGSLGVYNPMRKINAAVFGATTNGNISLQNITKTSTLLTGNGFNEVQDLWAGYFQGNVMVTDNLTVGNSTMTNNLIVGNSTDGTRTYLKIDVENGVSGSDCFLNQHIGRMIIDTSAGYRLAICTFNGFSYTWRYATFT